MNEQRLIEEAFQHHPEVRKFEKLIEVANAQYNQEQHARVPNVTISGAYQRDAGREGIIGGLSVPLPLWNQRQGDIAKALGLRRQAEANFHQAKISLKRGIVEQVQISKTGLDSDQYIRARFVETSQRSRSHCPDEFYLW